jgi:hypothetical protein
VHSSPNIIRVITSRNKWHTWENRNAYMALAEKSERNSLVYLYVDGRTILNAS